MANAGPVKKAGLTRREWLRLGVAAGAGAAAGALGATAIIRFLAPPTAVEGEVRDEIYHTTGSPGGQTVPTVPVRVTDLQEWEGVPALWRAVFVESSYLAGSGAFVRVIRVKRDDANFTSPPAAGIGLPPGFELFYDDPARDIRLVVAVHRCTHLCCNANWHLASIPPVFRDYVTSSPTYEVYGQDPIHCACHDAQWDPMLLVTDTHSNGVSYVGARVVHGPARKALPIVPVRAEADVLVGAMVDPRWYSSYCA